jgi:Helix-turn-helix domain
MTPSDKRPFKQLFCDRRETLKLPGNMLKVWLCHFMHEGEKRESWPSIETIMNETGLARTPVQRARADLKKHGWLVQVRAYHQPDGSKIVVYRVTRGSLPGSTYGGTTRNRTETERKPNQSRTYVQRRVAPMEALPPSQVAPVEVRRVAPVEVPEVDSLEVDSLKHEVHTQGVVRVASSKDQDQRRLPSDAELADRARRRALRQRLNKE